MSNWEAVYEFLQPKEALYSPEKPSVRQKVFLRTNAREALYGGSAGSGKSSALLMAALQYVDVPGYTGILFRKTYADLALPGALMDRFQMWMGEYPEVRWNSNNYVATFPTGARITFGYLNNVRDWERYKGPEFQFIGFDEVTEIREHDYIYMNSRLRRPKTGPISKVPLRMRSASNPAPNWVRQHFLVEGKKFGRVFVPAKFYDNPALDHASYRISLEALGTVERRQLLEGDWWISGGGSMFKAEEFLKIDLDELGRPQLPTFMAPKFCRYWDRAATEPSDSYADPDWTVGVLMAADQGITYILDVRRFRKRSHETESIIRQVAIEDGPSVAIRMEQEPGASGKDMISHYARNILEGFDFKGIRSSVNKVERARPYAAAVANNNVKYMIADWNSVFLSEHANFPENVDHDDQVDAASGAFNEVHGITGAQKRPASIIV